MSRKRGNLPGVVETVSRLEGPKLAQSVYAGLHQAEPEIYASMFSKKGPGC
jgi:hypothetical protein